VCRKKPKHEWPPMNADENRCLIRVHRRSSAAQIVLGNFGASSRPVAFWTSPPSRFHNGTASRRTVSRIRGLSERRITNCTRRPRSCSRSATRLPGNHGVVATGNVDKDVYIAFQRVVPASYQPEKPDIARTVAGGHAQDLVATLSDALRGGHLSILYRQVRVPALCGRARVRPLRFTYGRIRVKGALNDQTDLPHTQRRKRARQTLAEEGFLESGNKVALQPGWARQSRLSGLKSQGGWTVRALAAERNDQDGIDTFAYIAGVERHHQDPMAHRRISQHRGPDLATPGRCVMAGQSPTLERLCSKRRRDRPLPRQPWSSGH